MKISFYLFHRLGVWARQYARGGTRRAVFMAMALAFILAALHTIAFETVFRRAPEWVGSISMMMMTALAAGLTVWLALVAYRYLSQQQDDEVAARQRLNHELSEERNLIHAMMEATQDNIYFKDRESRFLRINDTMARRFGLKSASDAVGKTDLDFFPRELALQKMNDERSVMASGGPIVGIEEHDVVRDGRMTWVSTTKMPLRDRNGTIVGTFGISRDITDRKLAEEKFRGLLEAAPEAMVIVNANGEIVLVNSQTEKLFGHSRAELLGKPVEMLVPERWRSGHMGLRREYVMNPRSRPMGADLELFALRKDGSEFPADISLSPFETEEGRLVSSSIRDITERKQADARQKAISQGMQKILGMADELIACENEDMLFRRAVELGRSELGLERCAIYVDAGEHVCGTFGTDLNGKTTDERAHEFSRAGLWADRMRLRDPSEKRWDISEETYHEWRENLMAEAGRGPVAVSPIQSSQSDMIGVFCNDNAISGKPLDPTGQEIVAVYCSLIGNIVARKRAEAEHMRAAVQQRATMERTDRLNAVGLLAAGMAHEINNPLQGMLSHLRALQPYVPPDSAGRRNLDMAQKGIDTIASLVRRLLMLGSAGDDTGREGADIQEAIDFVTQLLESQFRRVNVRIERATEAQGIRVAMPRAELIQVIMNLLINARDAMPDGGSVRVKAEAEDDSVWLVVSDTGQGIAPELIGKIFAPFFTTKGSKGTGLGLSVTESLVRSHRGQISVKSEQGKGTTFDIILPRFQGEKK